MQVTFKTLKQTSFKLECSEDETVASVKAKIEAEKGEEFPATSQKLIHSGKIMEDAKQLKDYKVSEKGFIVVMVTTKGKVASEPTAKPTTAPEKESQSEAKPSEPVTQVPAETPKTQETQSAEPTKEETVTQETKEVPASTSPAVSPAPQPSEPAPTAREVATDDFGNALLTGSDFEACVERIMAMGFPREEVHQAMRLSYNNPDRAVEYLISGEDGDHFLDEGEDPYDNEEVEDDDDIGAGESFYEVPLEIDPEGMVDDQLFEQAEESEDAERIIHALLEGNMPQERDPAPEQGIGESHESQSQPASQPAPATQQPAAPQQQQPPQPPASGGADPFRELITQPQFQQMRQVLQQNPQLLAQLMEQLYRTNPDLFQVIRNNQERFLAYLNEESMESGGAPEIGGGSQPPVAIPEAQDPFSGAGGAGNTIRMTPQEREAIERLKALGFPEMMVIQAYFACDKNEDAAANFLLSEAFGDDD